MSLEQEEQLDKYNMANIFSIVQKGQKSYYNLSKTIRFKNLNAMLPKWYNNYIVTQKDTWTNLSYKFFNTYKLWWLLCKFNDVQDPFNFLQAGKVIKIPSEQIVDDILQSL